MKIKTLMCLIGLISTSVVYANNAVPQGAPYPYWDIKKISTGVFEFYSTAYAPETQEILANCTLTRSDEAYLNMFHVGPDRLARPTLNGAPYGEFNNHLEAGTNYFSFGMVAWKNIQNTFRFEMPCWKGATCSPPYNFNISCTVVAG